MLIIARFGRIVGPSTVSGARFSEFTIYIMNRCWRMLRTLKIRRAASILVRGRGVQRQCVQRCKTTEYSTILLLPPSRSHQTLRFQGCCSESGRKGGSAEEHFHILSNLSRTMPTYHHKRCFWHAQVRKVTGLVFTRTQLHVRV
jgi:hypothetical protein